MHKKPSSRHRLLTLNRDTIRVLAASELSQLAAGEPIYISTLCAFTELCDNEATSGLRPPACLQNNP